MSNSTTATGTREETYERRLALCQEELSRPYPDFQAAQAYATLSLEAAVRDLAGTIVRAADKIAGALR
jgi:hypothetical protein